MAHLDMQLPLVRRPRGRLEELILDLCTSVEDRRLVLPAGQLLTPYRLVKLLDERFPGSGVSPSTGGVRDTLVRWEKLGFAHIRRDPVAFVSLTPEGRQVGLVGMKAARRSVARQATPEEAGRSLGRSVVTDVVSVPAAALDAEPFPGAAPSSAEGMGLPESG